MAITTLFSMPQVVTIFTAGATSVSTPFNRIDFKLFKNVANKIDFLIKTVDKRATGLTNPRIIISTMDQSTVMSTPLVEIDRLRGHYRLVLLPNQVNIFTDVNYRYSVVSQDADTLEDVVAYTDTAYTASGYLHVDDTVSSIAIQPLSIYPGDFLKDPDDTTKSVSGFYPGAAQTNNITGRQTATIATTSFTGKVIVMATLDDTPRDDGWFEVGCRTLKNFTGLSPVLFTGNHMWLKFIIIEGMGNTGTVDEIKLKVQ